jgi:hypothetical protein
VTERGDEGSKLRLEEAEELLDSVLTKARHLAAKTAAMVREEAEDIVAEARALRQQRRSE